MNTGINNTGINITEAFPFEHLLRLNRVNNQAFFLSGFSHLIKNPINTIQLASDLLGNYTQDINNLFNELNDESERLPAGFQNECSSILATMPQVIQGISESASKLNQFVSYLSEFSGRGTFAASPDVDLNRLISHCARVAHQQICVYTSNFHLDLEPELPIMSGNAEQILMVILNLLMNSLLSLNDRSSAVVLSTSCNNATGRVQMCVRDEGAGISPDIYSNILDPFFSTRQEQGCIGIGLTVADQIVRNHGGTLSIDSEPGVGTSVLVSLPLQYLDKLETSVINGTDNAREFISESSHA